MKDGDDWGGTQYYQSSTTELKAVFAVSPLGSQLDCPLTEVILPPDNTSQWNILDDYTVHGPKVCLSHNLQDYLYYMYSNYL